MTIRARRTAVLATLLGTFLLGGCTIDMTIDGPRDEPLAHVVLVWLKEPGNEAHREQVIDASKRLREIEGVRRVTTGRSLPSDRDVVDDSFDVGLYVELDSPDALRRYATDPIHLDVLKSAIAPVTERYIVYDFDISR